MFSSFQYLLSASGLTNSLDTYAVLAVISAVLILAFIYDDFADKIRIPAIILLILTGVGLKELATRLAIETPPLKHLLPTTATIALLLIVLEGALELRAHGNTRKIVTRASISAFICIFATTIGIAGLLMVRTEAGILDALLSATTFSIISSTVAIPSVANLSKKRREFVIYESSISDIFGVIIFNFFLVNEVLNFGSFARLFRDLVLIVVLSIMASFIVMVLLRKLKSNARFSLILSILIFVYAISKILHLSSLVIILVFGVLLVNADKIPLNYIRKLTKYRRLKTDTGSLLKFTSEIAFVAKTVVFVLFGFTIEPETIFTLNAAFYGSAVVVIYLTVRLVVLKLVKVELLPNLFVAPRGLITILLFLSIPNYRAIEALNSGTVLFVIFVSCSIMPIGFSLARRFDKSGETQIKEGFSDLNVAGEHEPQDNGNGQPQQAHSDTESA